MTYRAVYRDEPTHSLVLLIMTVLMSSIQKETTPSKSSIHFFAAEQGVWQNMFVYLFLALFVLP
jgi:hypothetical protein